MTFYLKPMTTVSQRCGTSDDQQILNCVSPTFGDWKTIDWGRSSIGNLLNGMELASSFVDHFSTGSIPAFNVTRCPQFNILTDKNCWSTNVKLCHRLKDFLESHMWSKYPVLQKNQTCPNLGINNGSHWFVKNLNDI